MPVAEIAIIREIASEITKIFKRAGSSADRRQIKSVSRAFKQIYFFDYKTKSLLKELATGSSLSMEKIEEYYSSFQSTEHSVRFSLETIRKFSQDQKDELSVRIYNKIRSLSVGKWNIRLEVDHLFQELLAQIDRDDVKERSEKLLNAITELNRIIEEVDDELSQSEKG